VTQADLQVRRVEVGVPGTDRTMLVVEHPYEIDREVADVPDPCVDVRTSDGTGRRDLEVAEIRLLAGPGVVLWYVQA